MVDSGLCRNEVNKRSRRLIRMFGWGVEEGKVPAQVHWGLKAIAGLKKGRSGVRESNPVKPVPDSFVDAVKPHVPRQIAAMIELQRLRECGRKRFAPSARLTSTSRVGFGFTLPRLTRPSIMVRNEKSTWGQWLESVLGPGCGPI